MPINYTDVIKIKKKLLGRGGKHRQEAGKKRIGAWVSQMLYT